ncbi:MAG TPA: PIN domain-containing protein, partial [Methylococcales bacterium]
MIQISDVSQEASAEISEDGFNVAGKRVLLIDLENCPNQIQQLMNNLEHYSYVVVCYAQSGAKIPLDWVVPLTATVNNNRLKIAKMPNNGKNAADFGITFWAGVFMAQLPQETHFDIVSNDTDLDHVVSLLQSQQRSAERIGNKKDNAHLASATNEPVNQFKFDCLHEYCSHLVKHSKPAKKSTLLNSIKSKFKANIDPEELIEELIKQGVINVKDDKITYNPQKLNKYAGQ